MNYPITDRVFNLYITVKYFLRILFTIGKTKRYFFYSCVRSDRKMIFSEYFEGRELNPKRWVIGLGDGTFKTEGGTINRHSEPTLNAKGATFYAIGSKSRVEDVISTHDKFAIHYGRFEINCIAPYVDSRAFFTLMDFNDCVPRVDIYAVNKKKNGLVFSIYDRQGNVLVRQNIRVSSVFSFVNKYNHIALDWCEDGMWLEVNGELVFRFTNTDLLEKQLGCRMKVAIGNVFNGEGSTTPSKFKVNHIRIYK